MSALLAGRYRLDSLLGRGGMGEVHAGFDTVLERKVAVKTLQQTSEFDVEARARFRREALAAAALDHPFICKVYEVGEHDGRSFIVMEFIEGRTLDELITEGALTSRQLMDVAHETVQALEEAHRHGIIHRDLKPSNIMRDVHGHVKVLDFGLAKQTGLVSAEAVTLAAPRPGDTRPGILVGTPSYMSPEQVLGNPLDARSDVFSLGVVMHQLASGRHPFLKDSPADTMAAILRDQPSSTAGDLDVVPGFGQLVHRMLAKACAERFQTMGDVRGALDALRDSTGNSTPGSGTAATMARPQERTLFVARDTELADLSAHLDAMLLGRGGLVLLGGEPGVGKTRLARELQHLARQRGCAAITGQCYEQEGAPPFGPFMETMEQAVRMVPQAVRSALGDVAAEMTMLAPDLRRVFPDIPPLPDIPPEQKRRVLFNAYLTYVQRASSKSAAVVLFDDLHWADDSSVQLLMHLAPHLSSMRLLVVGTYRDVDLDAKRPFARALETLLRQRLATRISIKRLTSSGVDQLLTTMSGGARPPETFVRAVYDETEGNPFFVEEVFQHLNEEGRLFDERGGWKPDLRIEDIDVPEGVRLVVSRRVERLGEEARKVLTAAAVIGRSFPLDLLQPVANVSEDALLDVIDEADRAQLVQGERGREARYSFVHELIRSTLLSDLSLPRRQRLHVRVADALEERRTGSLESHIPMLAHHLYQAGAAVDQERAVNAIARAMLHARTSGAFEDALAFVDQLLSFDLAPDSDTLALVEEMQVDGLMALGRIDQALAASERYWEHALQRPDKKYVASAALRMTRLILWFGRGQDVVTKLQRALASLPPEAQGARAEVLAACGGVLGVGAGRLAEGEPLVIEALAIAERAGDPLVLGMVLTALSVEKGMQVRAEESLQLAERALAMLAGSHHLSAATAIVQKSGLLLVTGRLSELDRFLPEAEAQSRRSFFGPTLWSLQQWRIIVALMRTGDLGSFRTAVTAMTAPGLPPLLATVDAVSRATAHIYLGESDAAEQALRELIPPLVMTFGRRDDANRMAVLAWAGRDEEARAIWREISKDVTGAAPDVHGWQGAQGLLPSATALSLIGEIEACAALYPALEALLVVGHVATVYVIGPTSPHLALGVSADAGGRVDRAREHFEEALRLAETLPDRLLQPTVKMWFGRFLAARDLDAPRGIALLQDAAADFERLGMPLHHERAVRWLADRSVRPHGASM